MHILVTGAAGFIGADLSQKLLAQGHSVVGVDNFNDYYEVALKRARHASIQNHARADAFSMQEMDIVDRDAMGALFARQRFDVVVHLAAQAGVRYSIENPNSYIDSNLVGFGNILEACRHHAVSHLVYASSSSVYGANKNFPFKESDRVDNPVSLYAATKKANELMAHAYVDLYGFRCTGLRFFTVYGPWGRPDMAPFRFASRMLKGEPIPVYNHGDMIRDFTYIDDITEGVLRVSESQCNSSGYAVYNIGRGEPVQLMDFIQTLAKHLGVEPNINMLPMQDGDVPRTMADTTALVRDFDYNPSVSIDRGLAQFAAWYKDYYVQ
ncbi:NAD-dependent epimerase [Arenicella chitinivorans]|uniref:NAD-dependent epimerase n=1 Tax=Arenicella chitinivorans TaxID=1329800 RepID=A0A918RJB4_9GAMM|nr:SDR family NAD(P)-dependent oxidoreductase [Arenicella chitinivorans]GGZ99226.1 NAD-dependent epimerase [Arenicella chitinivorans]